jgi:CBS-domain-containing membrane protein
MRVKIIDDKFKNNKARYIVQCLVTTGILLVVLMYIDLVLETAIVASLGATTFIIFTVPHKNRSKARYIIGGYTCGVISGTACAFLVGLTSFLSVGVAGAIAVGLAMFLMVITDTEHPPAAAVALGLTIEGFDMRTIIVVYIVSIFLMLVKRYAGRWLIDLL